MPAETNRDDITFDGLQQFLIHLGFDRVCPIKNAIALEHESGALIVLSIPADGRSVRPADRTSVVTRLEYLGLVDDASLDRLRSGKLPIAS
jgi:hypothetical protein